MSRSPGSSRWLRNLGAAGLLGLLALALGADWIASERPWLGRVEGALRIRPNDASAVSVLRAPIPHDPHATAPRQALQPPSRAHWLGTDELGRDVAARLVHGARLSLTVAFGAVALYVLLGVALGLLAGHLGGRVDQLLSRVGEVTLSFPSLFLLLCVVALWRQGGAWPVVLVLGLTRWTEVMRLVRAEVLRLRKEGFVLAARALGAGEGRLLISHILPHALGPVRVAAAFGLAGAVLLESGLSFLGLGPPPPTASWGELLTQAHRYVAYPGAWWLTVFPGLLLFATVASANLLGEGLRGNGRVIERPKKLG
jgi:peptide/nickel transport system permease protein